MSTFKKRVLFISLFFLLGGCQGSEALKTTPANTDIVTVQNPQSAKYQDIYGNPVDFENAVYNEDTLSEWLETDEYVYLANCKGTCFHTRDDSGYAEMSEDERYDLQDQLLTYKENFFRAGIGSRFGDLVLNEAHTSYERIGEGEEENEISVTFSHARFSGTVTRNGFIVVYPESGNEMNGTSFIGFLPDNGEWENEPMVWQHGCTFWNTDDLDLISSAPILRLGKVQDYEGKIDTSVFPENWKVAYARVTLGDLELNYNSYFTAENTATLLEIKLL